MNEIDNENFRATRPAHTRAMTLWLLGSLALVFVSDDPWTSVVAILAASAVAATGDKKSTFKGFFVLGIFALLMRTVLFTLTGHTGPPILFHLPQIQLPGLFGGITLGGPVSVQVVLSAIVEGLRLLAAMSILGAFLATADIVDLLRLVPSFLFEAGLVVNIALVFAPQLARTATDVRDAQKMRGIGTKGHKALRPLFVPVLATALERSVSLAESMDSRGFGFKGPNPRVEIRPSVALWSGIGLAVCSSLWAMGIVEIWTIGPAVLGGLVLFWSLRRVGKTSVRTRYRKRKLYLRDLIAGLIPLLGAVFLSIYLKLTGPSFAFDPSNFALLSPDPVSVLAAASVSAPAIARMMMTHTPR